MKKIVLTALCALSLSTLTTQPAYRYRGPYSPTEQKPHRGPHHPSAHQERKRKMEEHRQHIEDRLKALEDKLAIISAEHEVFKAEIADLKVR